MRTLDATRRVRAWTAARDASGTTYLLVDGENIDATLGSSILGRRPKPEERPRWDRLLQFARDRWVAGAGRAVLPGGNTELPMTFVQALISMGYRPVPLAGAAREKVVDIAIQRTLAALADRDDDVLLVSNDGDFVEGVEDLLDGRPPGRRRRVHGVPQPRVHGARRARPRASSTWSTTSQAFTTRLPRVRIIPIDEFDPLEFL